MGFDVNRFPSGIQSIDPIVFCPLCKKVLDDPVLLDCVKLDEDPSSSSKASCSSGSKEQPSHIFCRTCIVEYFADSGIVCPVDGEKFKRNTKRSLISAPPKKIFDILSKLEISCDFHGCSKVVQLKHLEQHVDSCEFKAAPILKISLSGGTYNSITSYHHHNNSNTTVAQPVVDHSKRNGDGATTHESNHHSKRRTSTSEPTSEDTFDERLRKMERKYQEKLEVTKHLLEAKVDQYSHDQTEKIRMSYQKEIDQLKKAHHVQMSQVEEKLRKEVEGLKRHWIEDTQKPIKKQKLRRVETSPTSASPSGTSPRKDNYTSDSEEAIFARVNQRLEEIARIQKKELVHMITVEMVKTEKVLRQELKDLTQGLKKDVAKSGLRNVSDSSRAARASARSSVPSTSSSKKSSKNAITTSFVPMDHELRKTQQEVRVLRSEVRKLLRDSASKRPVATMNFSSLPVATSADDTSIIAPSLRTVAKREVLRKARVNKLNEKGKKKKTTTKVVKMKPSKVILGRRLTRDINKPAPLTSCDTSATMHTEPSTPVMKSGVQPLPGTIDSVLSPKKKPGFAVMQKKKRGRPPGKKTAGVLDTSSATKNENSGTILEAQGLFESDPQLVLDRVAVAVAPSSSRKVIKKRMETKKNKFGVCRRSTRQTVSELPDKKRSSRSLLKPGPLLGRPKKIVKKYEPKKAVEPVDGPVLEPGSEAPLPVPKLTAKKGLKGKKKRKGKKATKTGKKFVLMVPEPVPEDEATLTDAVVTEPVKEVEETPSVSEKEKEVSIEASAKEPEITVLEKEPVEESNVVEKEADHSRIPESVAPEAKKVDEGHSAIESSVPVKEAEKVKETPREQIPREQVPREIPREIPMEKPREVQKQKESGRRGDDILRAAMDAIGDGNDNYGETPSLIPLPPVATIAGKQFFASFPLSIPFSLPMSIPVFGRLTNSRPPVQNKQVTCHLSSTHQSTLITSTATTSFSPQTSSELLKPTPPKVAITKPMEIVPVKAVPSNEPEQSEDMNGDNSCSESTLPFRKRRAATSAAKGSEQNSSSANSGAPNAPFDESAASEFNIINHILQIEENLKPGDKSSGVNGTAKATAPVPTDDDESDELENFASITEQVLNELNSDEEVAPSGEPITRDPNLNYSLKDGRSGQYSCHIPPPEAPTTSSVEDEPGSAVSGPNATLVSARHPTTFQPYLDDPPRMHNLTQVPLDRFYPAQTDVPYNYTPREGHNSSDHPPPSSASPTVTPNGSWY